MEGEVSCLHCHSRNVKFKYLNNGKGNQHRYRCLECKEWFTWEDHKRPKPKHYKKVRNQDPVEIQGQRTQCTKCFAVNKARFKFYNNKERYGETQPRFWCLNCHKFFQMHLKGGVLVALKSDETTMNNSGENIEPGGACEYEQDGEILDCFARQLEADLEEGTQSDTAMSLADQGSNYTDPGCYNLGDHGDYVEAGGACTEYKDDSKNIGAGYQEADAMSLANVNGNYMEAAPQYGASLQYINHNDANGSYTEAAPLDVAGGLPSLPEMEDVEELAEWIWNAIVV